MSAKLKECVEVEKLNACPLNDVLARNAREDFVHQPLRSIVSITDRMFDKVAFCIDQTIINSPAINSDAPNLPPEFTRPLARLGNATLNLAKNMRNVPSQITVGPRGRVLK